MAIPRRQRARLSRRAARRRPARLRRLAARCRPARPRRRPARRRPAQPRRGAARPRTNRVATIQAITNGNDLPGESSSADEPRRRPVRPPNTHATDRPRWRGVRVPTAAAQQANETTFETGSLSGESSELHANIVRSGCGGTRQSAGRSLAGRAGAA